MIDTDRLLKTFLDLVRIDSPTFKEGGVVSYLECALAELGLEVSVDTAGRGFGGERGNVLARLPGNRPGRPVMLNAHLDSIDPCLGITPVVEDGAVRSDGTTVLGADDKAGVAVIMETLCVLLGDKVPHAGVEIVFTVAEEKGMLGAKSVDAGALRAESGYSLDADGPVGTIVVRAPTQDNITFTFRGRAAHAGMEPEKGVSAIVAAARAVTGMRLGRIDEETTANIGVIAGGLAANIVAEDAVLRGEARSHDVAKLLEQVEQMRAAAVRAAEEVGAGVEVDVERAYEGYGHPEDAPVVLRAVEACRRLGIAPRITATGGGSDANVLNAKGLAMAALGLGMTDIHSTRESIKIESLVSAVRFAVELVRGSAQLEAGG